MLLRLVRVVLLFKYKKALVGWQFWATLLGLWSPGILYGIVASTLKLDGPITDPNGIQICLSETSVDYFTFTLLFLYGVLVLVSISLLDESHQVTHLWL
jgi:hypothetical protein